MNRFRKTHKDIPFLNSRMSKENSHVALILLRERFIGNETQNKAPVWSFPRVDMEYLLSTNWAIFICVVGDDVVTL